MRGRIVVIGAVHRLLYTHDHGEIDLGEYLEALGKMAIVDDDPGVRGSIVSLLRSAGLTVLPFAGGAALLESPQLEAFACIVTDGHMEGVDGPALQLELNRRGCVHPAHRNDRLPYYHDAGADAGRRRVRVPDQADRSEHVALRYRRRSGLIVTGAGPNLRMAFGFGMLA